MIPIDDARLAVLAVPPLAVIAAYGIGLRGRAMYRLAFACAAALLAAASLPLARAMLPPIADKAGSTGVSVVLTPFAALIWFIGVATTPVVRLDEAGAARNALACLLTMAAFTIPSPWVLAACWAGTSLIFVFGQRGEYFRRPQRLAFTHAGLSTVLFAAGILLIDEGFGGAAREWGAGVLLAAIVIRKGIFPFHAWIPEIFDRGRIGPAISFNAPQLGTYAALILAVPVAGLWMLRSVAALSAVTAVWAGLLALRQTSARRACGYIFVSQSALALTGLCAGSEKALAGGLLLWISSGIAVAGLSRCVLALEARRGDLRLDAFHGGFERMPLVASSFFVLCLTIANFPGSLGFVGGEMLVRGTVETRPLIGLFAVSAGALNSLAVMRMYWSLFCGKRESGVALPIKRNEALGFATAALFLIGFGLWPRGLVCTLSHTPAGAVEARPSVR